MWLTLWSYSIYCDGLEPNPQHLQGLPVCLYGQVFSVLSKLKSGCSQQHVAHMAPGSSPWLSLCGFGENDFWLEVPIRGQSWTSLPGALDDQGASCEWPGEGALQRPINQRERRMWGFLIFQMTTSPSLSHGVISGPLKTSPVQQQKICPAPPPPEFKFL